MVRYARKLPGKMNNTVLNTCIMYTKLDDEFCLLYFYAFVRLCECGRVCMRVYVSVDMCVCVCISLCKCLCLLVGQNDTA